MSTLEVDLELIKKYNQPGPRYTSYPPANYFGTGQNEGELLKSISDSNREERDLSLYFHLPFCQSLCWFCGCNKIITTKQSGADSYIDYLEKEILLRKPHLNPSRKVAQLHYGGGTPTFFSADQLTRLGDIIFDNFTFSDNPEISIEIDPRSLTPDQPAVLRKQGFWRASLGLQDFNPIVQKAIHRIQPEKMTQNSVDWLRNAGFTSINVDLIYGLPHQTVKSFEETLDRAIALNPDRFAIFNYAHMPSIIPAQRIIDEAMMPEPEVKLDMLKLIIEKLSASGWVYVGMDHFARPEDELTIAQKEKTLQRNFQGYSTCAGIDIQAYGISSISQNETAYYQNHKKIEPWMNALDAGELPISRSYVLNNDDLIRRHVIMELMCNLELDYQGLSVELDIDFKDYFSSELLSLKSFEDDRLLKLNENSLQVTTTGRLLIRNIAMTFDRFSQNNKKLFSKTI